MSRVLGVSLMGAWVACGAQAAPAPALVIQGDQVLAGVHVLAERAAVEAKLGPPDSARRISMYQCRLLWRRLGLSLSLIDLSWRAPCRAGVFQSATVTSPAWRTAKGLRVGSTRTQLRSLYPRARRHDDYEPYRGWWLVPRRACSEVGGSPYPGLLARVRAGRVTALVMAVAACE